MLKNLYYTSIVLFLLADFSPKISAQEVRRFTENEFRTRYYNLVDELRCPKCQNQNLADSNSLIAIDLRNEIHSMLEDGRTNKEIIKPSNILLEFAAGQYEDPMFRLGEHEWPALKRMLKKNNSIYDQ